MSAPELKVVYRPRPDITPEREAAALGSVYRFVLNCHKKKGATPESRPNDAERKSGDGAKDKYTG